MTALLIALLIALSTGSASGVEGLFTTVSCTPHQSAKLMVYLHGLESMSTSKEESRNRETMARVAGSLGVGLLTLSSNTICKGQRRCWPHYEQQTLQKLISEILHSARKCAPLAKTLGLVGYSNGGYAAAKSAVQCNPDFAFYIAVGAGRSSAVLKRPSTPRCPPIEFISGVKDLKFNEAKSYVDALVSQGFSAHFSSHQGGHKIEEHSLRKALIKFF